jgi:hypothetical protein
VIQAYLQTIFPPIPALDIVLSAPASDHWGGPFTAIVDSGADFTIIPLALMKSLDAPVIRPAVLSSQWRDKHSVYIYKVDIRVGEITLPAMDAAGDPFSDEIILGRNVLNRLDLRLEGPALRTHLM